MAFPVTLDTDFGIIVNNVDATDVSQINEIRRAVEGLEAKIGIDDSLVTTSLDYMVNSFFEAGRRLWLYEDAAPTGWTYLSSIADRVIGVKGGSNAFNVVGGNQAGTWTHPTHTHTGSSHNHKWYDYVYSNYQDKTYDSDGSATNLGTGTNVAGGFSAIEYTTAVSSKTLADSYTNNAGTGATGASGTANTWRPYGAVGIIVEKD